MQLASDWACIEQYRCLHVLPPLHVQCAGSFPPIVVQISSPSPVEGVQTLSLVVRGEPTNLKCCTRNEKGTQALKMKSGNRCQRGDRTSRSPAVFRNT